MTAAAAAATNALRRRAMTTSSLDGGLSSCFVDADLDADDFDDDDDDAAGCGGVEVGVLRGARRTLGGPTCRQTLSEC